MILVTGITNGGFIMEYIHKDNPKMFNKACEIALPKEAIELLENLDAQAKEVYNAKLNSLTPNWNKTYDDILNELKELQKTDEYAKSLPIDKEGVENIIKTFELIKVFKCY